MVTQNHQFKIIMYSYIQYTPSTYFHFGFVLNPNSVENSVTRVSLYHTVKTICVAMLLLELQSPMVSVGNTIRTQMFHEESTRSKKINQLNILAAKHLKETTIKRDEKPKNGERNST